jgi:hypothetical protein
MVGVMFILLAVAGGVGYWCGAQDGYREGFADGQSEPQRRKSNLADQKS